jgi:hypothetical protein
MQVEVLPFTTPNEVAFPIPVIYSDAFPLVLTVIVTVSRFFPELVVSANTIVPENSGSEVLGFFVSILAGGLERPKSRTGTILPDKNGIVLYAYQKF